MTHRRVSPRPAPPLARSHSAPAPLASLIVMPQLHWDWAHPLPLLAASHVHHTGKDSPALVQIVSCLWLDAALLYTKGAFLHSLTPLGSSMYLLARTDRIPDSLGEQRGVCWLPAHSSVATLLAACGALRAACCTWDVGDAVACATTHCTEGTGRCRDYRKDEGTRACAASCGNWLRHTASSAQSSQIAPTLWCSTAGRVRHAT
jgi:hypothetical protein